MAEGTINDRVTRLERYQVRTEAQMDRIVSDIESEKGTRARSNADLELRMRCVEKALWKGAGAIMALQVVLSVILALIKMR